MTPKLEKLLRAAPNLPSLPGVAVELVAECRRPEVDLDRICDLLARDPALSAKLVSVANSAAYRRGTPATTVKRAALALGTSAVTALALSFSLVTQRAAKGSFDFAQYWRRGLLSAVSARALAQRAGTDPDEAFLAALLQDIGVLALHAALPKHADVVQSCKHDHLRLERLERESFGAGHPEVGAWLASTWGLPVALVHAVAGSHVPLQDERASVLGRCVAASGYVADIWIRSAAKPVTHAAAQAAAAWLSLSDETFHDVLTHVSEAARDYAEAFEVTLPTAKEMKATLQQARDTLVQVSLRATQVATRSEADAQRLAAEKKTLEQQFQRDALTGVFTRGYLDAALALAYEASGRFDSPLGVLFCDIDHFKKVNDGYGHATGDKVLSAVARELSGAVRQLDVVGRYGGEEFIVILPSTNGTGAMVVAERIRERVQALKVTGDNGQPVPVTISVGQAVHGEGWKSRDLADLLAAADKALYLAKHTGRNRCVAHAG